MVINRALLSWSSIVDLVVSLPSDEDIFLPSSSVLGTACWTAWDVNDDVLDADINDDDNGDDGEDDGDGEDGDDVGARHAPLNGLRGHNHDFDGDDDDEDDTLHYVGAWRGLRGSSWSFK